MPEVLASALTREHGQAILRLERDELSRLVETYEQARLELMGRLASIDGDTFTAQHLRVTLAQVEAGVSSMRSNLGEQYDGTLSALMGDRVDEILAEIAAHEPKFGAGPVGRIRVDALRRISEVEELLLHQFQTSMATYGSGLIREIQGRLGVHLVKRSTMRDMAIDVAGRLREHAFRGARWRAERIVRTEIINAASAGHQAALEAAGAEIPGLKRQWDATLDARTSHICETLNGQVRPIDQPFNYAGREVSRPPAHPNCRSRLVPWHADWADG